METQHSPQNPTPHFLTINKISPGYEDTKTPLPLTVLWPRDPRLSNTARRGAPLPDAPFLKHFPVLLPFWVVTSVP